MPVSKSAPGARVPLMRSFIALALVLALSALSCGRKPTGPKVFVIGLDGATFDLLDPWLAAGELPNLKSLMDGGVYGELHSVHPILSPVAWTSAATGVNPGKHGIFDFERPDPDQPGKSLLYTSESRRAVPVWKLLSDAGRTVGILNVPMTWPPDPVNGVMVSGFPFPDAPNLSYTYPKELQASLGDYALDRMGEALIRDAEAAMLATIVKSRDDVARVTGDWLRTRNDDFTWTVFTATDRIQHFFWGMMDPQHPYYTEQLGKDFGEAIHEFWKGMDKRLGEILALLPEDAVVIVISDHGFGPIYREVNALNWFGRSSLNDYVRNHKVPDVFITNGIFRYRLGTTWPMSPEYDTFRSMFVEQATAIVDPLTGKKPVERVVRREELYSGRMVEKAPDLVMIEAPECYIGPGDPAKDLDTVTDLHSTSYSGYHRPNGIFIIKGPGINRGELAGASLVDVAPTILYTMGECVPQDMDGRVLTAVFGAETLKKRPPCYSDGTTILTDRPERTLSPEEKRQLEAVPYIK